MKTSPLVEVKRTEDNLPLVAAIENAESIGWADGKRLLLLKGGRIAVFDVATGKTFETPIRAKSARVVFVR